MREALPRAAKPHRILAVRRFSTVLLFVAAMTPTALGLVFSAVDWEAIRCAARCGHAIGNGAICCPANASPAQSPSLRACPAGDAALVRAAAIPPALLGTTARWNLPETTTRSDETPGSQPISAVPAPLDHVPLWLS